MKSKLILILVFIITINTYGQEYENGTIVTKHYDTIANVKIEKLSDAWYRGFLNRFSAELTRSGTTVKDTKRNTWVTKENFVNMYENVYEEMVLAGIAEKKEEEIEYLTYIATKIKVSFIGYYRIN